MYKYILVVIALLFIGCGTDNKDSNTHIEINNNINDDKKEELKNQLNPRNYKINGNLLNNSIIGADICVDVNHNDVCEKDEPSTSTDNNGTFKLNIDETTLKENKSQIIAKNGINIVTGEIFNGVIKSKIDNNNSISLNVISTLSSYLGETRLINIFGEHNINNNTFSFKLEIIFDLYNKVFDLNSEEYNSFLKEFSSKLVNQEYTLTDILNLVLTKIDNKLAEDNLIVIKMEDKISLLKEDLSSILKLEDNSDENFFLLNSNKNIIVEYIVDNTCSVPELYSNIDLNTRLIEHFNTFRILNILNIAKDLKEKEYFLNNTNFIFTYNLDSKSTIVDFEEYLLNDMTITNEKKCFSYLLLKQKE